MPELVQCAIMHAHFETIHPFLDGNGRIGRLLITLFLIERGLLSEPLLYVSSYIEKHKAAYYETLQRTRTHGDWIGWVAYFLEAIRSSAADAVNNARALLTLRAELHANPALAKKARERRLIDELFSNPYVTVQHARKLLGVSTVTATRAIETLQALGILEERTGKAWGRIWLAKPILRALEE
jgi:Fic family protein